MVASETEWMEVALSDEAEGRVVVERHGYHHGNLRQALLEAGLELTRSGGAAALVLRDVTRRVGVSPNAAYRHFADRVSLLRAVAEQIQHSMADRMRAFDLPGSPGSGDGSPERRRLRAVGLGYIAFALAEPGWFDTAFANVGSLLTTSPGAPAPLPLEMLLSALDGLVATGELAAERRPGAEWPCWSAVHGFAMMALHGPLQARPADDVWAAAERTVDAIITGVLAEAG
jgi:AcrR family transcriptional regulator